MFVGHECGHSGAGVAAGIWRCFCVFAKKKQLFLGSASVAPGVAALRHAAWCCPCLIVVLQDARSNEKTKIKVSPGTLMTEVLADYCKQKGLELERATLLHKGKPLDLSSPFRLTGLANNATLTVGQRASAAVPVCTIALQLEDGSRVQGKFQVSNTLWQVLLGFEAQDAKLNVTRRMQPQPPSGEGTGFLGLGAPKEGPVGWMQPVVTLLNKKLSTIEELNGTTLQSLGLTSGSCLLRVTHQWTPRDAVPSVDVAPAAVVAVVSTPSPPASAPAAAASISSSVTAAITPSAPNAATSSRGGNDNNAPVDDVVFAKPDPVAPRPSKSQKTVEEEKEAAPLVDATVPENRNFVVFQPNDTPFNPASFEVPDDFYNLAPSDFASLQSGAGKEEVLMTREFREKKKMAAYAKFVKTNIRVRFPDRWELQGTFLSREGTMELVEFVRRFVSEDREFVLYTTPPKQNLENASFSSQRLMPAAVVYFAWEEKRENDVYLTEDAKKSAIVFGAGTVHLSTFSSQTPLDYTVVGSGTGDNGSEAHAVGGKGKEEMHDEKKTKKPGVPSWLRLKK